MRTITFEEFYNQDKEELRLHIYKDNFECIINECDFNKIEIDQYLNAVKTDNLKISVFKFYLPKKKTICIEIFYSEEQGSYFKKTNKRWQYKIISKNRETLFREDLLDDEFCRILNNENQDIRNNIKDFFVALGCNSTKISLVKIVQQSIDYYEDSKNEEVIESGI